LNAVKDYFASLDYTVLYTIFSALIAVTFHEVAHGYAAMKLGDPTARAKGRLSLNPLHHIDILGLLMMVFFRFGWAKPVPVDMRYFKHPKSGMAITALSGPLSNFVMAFLGLLLRAAAVLLYVRTGKGLFLTDFFLTFAALNLGLGLFNLIPIPPLDGSKVLFGFLPDRAYLFVLRYERWCGILLVLLLLYKGFFNTYLNTALNFVLQLMWKAASLPLTYIL